MHLDLNVHLLYACIFVYAFRPTGSTQAALVSILHHISDLLVSNKYVRVIALDFFKAFDTVRHENIADKLNNLPIADNVYNWFVNYFFES